MLSAAVLEHFYAPRNHGPLPDPSGEGMAGSWERGEYVKLQVQVEDGRITAARFLTVGCAPLIACGSRLTEWVTGRSVAEAEQFTPDQLEAELGGLPPRRRRCAGLAVEALRQALDEARRRGEGPG